MLCWWIHQGATLCWKACQWLLSILVGGSTWKKKKKKKKKENSTKLTPFTLTSDFQKKKKKKKKKEKEAKQERKEMYSIKAIQLCSNETGEQLVTLVLCRKTLTGKGNESGSQTNDARIRKHLRLRPSCVWQLNRASTLNEASWPDPGWRHSPRRSTWRSWSRSWLPQTPPRCPTRGGWARTRSPHCWRSSCSCRSATGRRTGTGRWTRSGGGWLEVAPTASLHRHPSAAQPAYSWAVGRVSTRQTWKRAQAAHGNIASEDQRLCGRLAIQDHRLDRTPFGCQLILFCCPIAGGCPRRSVRTLGWKSRRLAPLDRPGCLGNVRRWCSAELQTGATTYPRRARELAMRRPAQLNSVRTETSASCHTLTPETNKRKNTPPKLLKY